MNSPTIKVRDREHLEELVQSRIRKYGPLCDLNHLDVSKVSSMQGVFGFSPFNGDISRWDVSNVNDMRYIFSHSDFKGDLSKWDISQVQLADQAFGINFHDSPLGYLCILQGHSDFPKNDPRAAQFQQLRAVAASLDLDDVGAAQFIYESMHPLSPCITMTPESFTDFQMPS